MHDARWGLDQVSDRLGQTLPICLVGHSLGGRAALLTTDCPEVRSAVALAPYVHPTDVPARIPSDQILIVHGTDDRIASPARSAELARRLSAHAQVGFVSVKGATHPRWRNPD